MEYEYELDLVYTLLLKNNVMEKMENMTGLKIIGRGNDRPILSPAGSLLGVLEITPHPIFQNTEMITFPPMTSGDLTRWLSATTNTQSIGIVTDTLSESSHYIDGADLKIIQRGDLDFI